MIPLSRHSKKQVFILTALGVHTKQALLASYTCPECMLSYVSTVSQIMQLNTHAINTWMLQVHAESV